MITSIPTGFAEIGPAEHPRDGASGTLIRNRATGIYALWDGRVSHPGARFGGFHPAPNAWRLQAGPASAGRRSR